MTRCHFQERTMPKPTFFNLPKEKQETLIFSIKKEFSRVPLYEASIANIVKDANIPRGSFYQYFEDKEDAFYYLLEQSTKTNGDRFISLLKETNGDIFKTFQTIFKTVLKEFKDKENHQFFKNAFLHMNYRTETIFNEMFNGPRFKRNFTEVSEVINTKQLKISKEIEVIYVVHIVIVMTVHHLMINIVKDNSIEEAVNDYEIEMNLLKRGLYVENI